MLENNQLQESRAESLSMVSEIINMNRNESFHASVEVQGCGEQPS